MTISKVQELIEAAYDAGVARALKQVAEGRWGSNDKADDLAALTQDQDATSPNLSHGSLPIKSQER